MNNQLIKLDKYEIKDQYNLSDRTYYHKLKQGLNTYSEEQLYKKGHYNYLISQDIVDEVFTTHRKPNKNDVNKIKDYILSSSFNYIGCIRPRRSTLKENINRIEHIFSRIIKEHTPAYLNLFYSIENNNSQPSQYKEQHTHLHILIQTDKKKDFIQKTKNILSTYSDSRVFFEKYNTQWEMEGKKYTIKDVSSSDNCSYLSYRARS